MSDRGTQSQRRVWRWRSEEPRQRRNSHVWGLRPMPQQGTLYKGGLCVFHDGREVKPMEMMSPLGDATSSTSIVAGGCGIQYRVEKTAEGGSRLLPRTKNDKGELLARIPLGIVSRSRRSVNQDVGACFFVDFSDLDSRHSSPSYHLGESATSFRTPNETQFRTQKRLADR